MTNIVRFERQGPPGKGLARWEDIAADSLVAGKPVQRGHFYFEDKGLGLSAGVWSCTAMTAKAAPYSVNEFMILLEGAVTIIDAQGRETVTKAGQSFLIPKGMVCAWKQTGYVRKFFVIFDDAQSGRDSGLSPADPAALKVMQPDPKAALGASEGPAPELLLSPPPVQRDKQYFADLTGQWTVGVWDSTAYHRKTITFPRHELMHILEGEVTLTEEGAGGAGTAQHFKAGDTFFVPMGTRCDWQSKGRVRKLYCIMQPKAGAGAGAEREAAE
jgi:uncharacterized cupin superfamily protein